MKILIVEDSPTQAERLKYILEQNGYATACAVNGQDALNKLSAFKPDIMISDIIMPEMNGYELCKRVRLNPQFHDITFILLSTLSDLEDIVSGLECGANYIITKPYKDDCLPTHLHKALEIQKIRANETEENTVKILVNGNEHVINAKKAQIVDFLISIYDSAVQKNSELYKTRLELQELNNILERKVEERTTALRVESEERKRYEQQFLEAQKLESVGQLAGGIAHDFNNLLMIMQGNLEMMKLDLVNDEKNSSRLDEALIAIGLGIELIKRLMAFSRRQELQPKFTHVKELILNIVKLLKPILGEAIQVNTIVPDDIWPIFVDPHQFENALINLAVNARDAMKGNGTFTIQLSNLALDDVIAIKKYHISSGDYIKISLSDNGEGIPANIIQRVFEPFFTTKEPGKGTGLGLSMVHGFIKQSMGHITIYSEVGHGTTVNLYLPRSKVQEVVDNSQQNVSIKTLHGTATILVVEDEESLRRITAEYLKNLGYRVLEADNGANACEIMKQTTDIHLLLTDVIMPGEMTGDDLADQALKLLPAIKILFVSGYPKNVLISNKQLRNADHQILMKPYSMMDLARMIKSILDGG